ncbi:hypothetical protein ABEB36_013865 [Hypothenemus hampei]|uniref:receptor protein-tyrosine kinase n=1 Tax=Hypothenemus hampei TaxID=57062 RepID=A0ABD1E6E7_HYPHA
MLYKTSYEEKDFLKVNIMKQIGTTKLTYIARGYVKIAKTPSLCYVNTINWTRIGYYGRAYFQPFRNDCPQCPAHCNGYCWNENNCQVFSDDCHEECLGCTKNHSNAHCEVCKNYENDGICVAECPEGKYTLRLLGKCVSEKECLSRNNETKKEIWFIHDKECRNDCPEETHFDPRTNSCIPCYDKCVKYCDKAKLVNRLVIESMKGCTHINGSLTIQNLKNEYERKGLYEHLKSIRYIQDYLLIARNEKLENLQFLPNLREIGGKNLYANKSIMVFENRNLKTLWQNTNVSIKIGNGEIGFHDNEQLCLTEIKNFAESSKINYSVTDVSEYSNGALCYESIDNDLIIEITNITSENVTLSWEIRNKSIELYYDIHYTASLQTEESSQDVCGSSGWTTFSSGNNSVVLFGLEPYTTYHYYIKTYMMNMRVKRTSNRTFQTPPDDPYFPGYFLATAVDHQSVALSWSRPSKINGNLSHYFLNIDEIPYDCDLTKKRDYCLYPFSLEGATVDLEYGYNSDVKIDIADKPRTVTLPKEKIIPEPPSCGSAISEETNIRLIDDVWLYLCDKKSSSKYGFDYCKNYYYDMFSKRNKRTMSQYKEKTSRSLDEKLTEDHQNNNDHIPTIKIAPDQTNYTVTKLKHFTLYVFYLSACNEPHKGRKLCSGILQTATKTKKRISFDDITNFSVGVTGTDISVTWTPPPNPNGFIVGYNIYHGNEIDHERSQKECITREQINNENSYILKNMPFGTHYLRLQTISLAGPGNITEYKFVEISSRDFKLLWLILVALILIILIIVVSMYFYKKTHSSEDIQLIRQVNPDYSIAMGYEPDEWEISYDDIEMKEEIGKGAFGLVYSGKIKSKELKCAIKIVRAESSLEDHRLFLREASRMKELSHGSHVVKLLGIVSKRQPPMVIMELMDLGDLKSYLLRECPMLSSNEIYRMAIEIADGLVYLYTRKFVHRDLAARNCMITSGNTVKIGDFGMTRDVYQNDYYKKGSGQALLPVRWMAPESIADGIYTYDSDIWSYGIVLWEIVTLASQPYQGMSNEEVTRYVLSRKTLDRPPECPNLLWEIMKNCWVWIPDRRLTCVEIFELLESHVDDGFRMLSFYHSPIGTQILAGKTFTRSRSLQSLDVEESIDPLMNPLLTQRIDDPAEPEYVPPSSPQKGHSSLAAKMEEQAPLVARDSDSEAEEESQL